MSISVIIPVYNGEKYLQESIQSVLNQCIVPDEIIVVDDGSTDNSAAVAKSFSQVSYHYQENQGVSGARNTGIKLSTGQILGFLDADDLWTPDKLKSQIEVLKQRPEVDAVFGLVEQFYSPELDNPPLEKLRIHPGILCGLCLIRRGFFDKVGLFNTNYNVGEFVDWYARAQEIGVVSHAINRVLLKRRLHQTNIGVVQKDKRTDYARILKAALDRRRNGRPAMDKPIGSEADQGFLG